MAYAQFERLSVNLSFFRKYTNLKFVTIHTKSAVNEARDRFILPFLFLIELKNFSVFQRKYTYDQRLSLTNQLHEGFATCNMILKEKPFLSLVTDKEKKYCILLKIPKTIAKNNLICIILFVDVID